MALGGRSVSTRSRLIGSKSALQCAIFALLGAAISVTVAPVTAWARQEEAGETTVNQYRNLYGSGAASVPRAVLALVEAGLAEEMAGSPRLTDLSAKFEVYYAAMSQAEETFAAALSAAETPEEHAVETEYGERRRALGRRVLEPGSTEVSDLEREFEEKRVQLGARFKRFKAGAQYKRDTFIAFRDLCVSVAELMPQTDSARRWMSLLRIAIFAPFEQDDDTFAEFNHELSFSRLLATACADPHVRSCCEKYSLSPWMGQADLWVGEGAVGAVLSEFVDERNRSVDSMIELIIAYWDRLAGCATEKETKAVMQAGIPDMHPVRTAIVTSKWTATRKLIAAVTEHCSPETGRELEAMFVRMLAPRVLRPQWLEQGGADAAKAISIEPEVREAISEVLSRYHDELRDVIASSLQDVLALRRLNSRGEEKSKEYANLRSALLARVWAPHDRAMTSIAALLSATAMEKRWSDLSAAKRMEDRGAFGPN